MKPSAKDHTRPYWHVDAKWICAILALFALGLALMFYTLSTVTKRDFAVRTSATVIGNLFSREGLDSDEGLKELQKKARNTPGDTVTPIKEFPAITIPKEDIQTLEPRELRIKLFSQLTGTVYDKGLEGAADDFTNNPKDREEFINQASVLGVFTESTHQTVKTLFWITAIVAIVFLAGVIYFSAGWGRLVSPGLLLLLVGIPGSIIGLFIANMAGEGGGPLANLPDIRQDLSDSFNRSYLFATIVGVFLLLVAFIGKMSRSVMQKSKNNSKKNKN
jgi:hypothetical protein